LVTHKSGSTALQHTMRETFMRTISGLFDSHADATAALDALVAAGFPRDDISIVANNWDGALADQATNDVQESTVDGIGTGAGLGAALGGAGGLLAGLGALVIPGLGPVVAGGWLLSTAIGAVAGAAVGGAAGGIVGAMMEAGVPEHEAHVYAEGVRRGGTLVTVRAEESRASLAEDILNDARRVDVTGRRSDYEAEGWDGFDEAASPFTSEQIRDYREVSGRYGV
jgi:hypothetical protein